MPGEQEYQDANAEYIKKVLETAQQAEDVLKKFYNDASSRIKTAEVCRKYSDTPSLLEVVAGHFNHWFENKFHTGATHLMPDLETILAKQEYFLIFFVVYLDWNLVVYF